MLLRTVSRCLGWLSFPIESIHPGLGWRRPIAEEGYGAVAASQVAALPGFLLAGAEVGQWIQTGGLVSILFSEPDLVAPKKGVLQQRSVVGAEDQLSAVPIERGRLEQGWPAGQCSSVAMAGPTAAFF